MTVSMLRPCPFCGSRKLAGYFEMLNGAHTYMIHCEKCKAMITFDNDEDTLIIDIDNRYNRRFGDD